MNKNLLLAVVLLLLLAPVALRAGAPLICHPYDIGTAKTLPGGDANRQVENMPEGTEVTIILNGRSQVLTVRPWAEYLADLADVDGEA